MVDGVAARQTLDLHDKDAGPDALFNLGKNPLHHWAGSDGVTRDDLAVNIGHVEVLPFRQLEQSVLVPGECFALAVRFGLEVGTRLAQVYEILLHDDLQTKKARAGAQANRLLVAVF